MEKLMVDNFRMFSRENIPNHLTLGATFWMQLGYCYLYHHSWFGFWGNPWAFISAFLAAGPQSCQELKHHCRASTCMMARFLILSLSLVFPFSEKKTIRLFVLFSMIFLPFKLHEMNIHCFWTTRRSLGIWVLSSKPWCCLELAWYSQLGLVLSYWPQTI